MKQIALAYRSAMEDRGIEVARSPEEQLRESILRVFASWDSEQARIYRRQMHLSDEWGTAVIVQTMIFGNLNDQSGSGVVFTVIPKARLRRSPSAGISSSACRVTTSSPASSRPTLFPKSRG